MAGDDFASIKIDMNVDITLPQPGRGAVLAYWGYLVREGFCSINRHRRCGRSPKIVTLTRPSAPPPLQGTRDLILIVKIPRIVIRVTVGVVAAVIIVLVATTPLVLAIVVTVGYKSQIQWSTSVFTGRIPILFLRLVFIPREIFAAVIEIDTVRL